MSKIVERIVAIVKTLKPQERRKLMQLLSSSGLSSFDEPEDVEVATKHSGPGRPLSKFIADMKERGKLK